MKETQTKFKPTIQVYSEVEDAILNLEAIPSLLNLIIDQYHLDDISKKDEDRMVFALDFLARKEDLLNLIVLTRDIVYESVSKIHSIKLGADPDDVQDEKEV